MKLRYDNLLREAADHGLYVIENATFQSQADGLINGDVIGINKKIRSTTERTCILAEELGHHYTTVGNIIDLTDTGNRKQEYRARLWSYNKLIGLSGIISTYKAGCRTIHDAAAHLDVTEEFFLEALKCYREKYGLYKIVDNYIVYFEPLGVLEIQKKN